MKILKTYQRPFVRERRQEINVNKLKTNEKNKIKFLTEDEPSLPNIYNRCRKTSLLLKSYEELRNIFKTSVRDFQMMYWKWGKIIKESLPNTNINTRDSSNIVSYGWYNCGTNCIDCKYLNEKGEHFYSYLTNRQYKISLKTSSA